MSQHRTLVRRSLVALVACTLLSARSDAAGDDPPVVTRGLVLRLDAATLAGAALAEDGAAVVKWASTIAGPVAVDNTAVPLRKILDAPAIQVLQSGFHVRQLPVQLANVNNVRYRRDGKLIALGYNGDIHILSDTDDDGLEDHMEVFWKNEGSIRGPIGMALTPENYSHGDGVFVPGKGKVSLIVDRDGDDRADEEIVVASGWTEIPQNVDAVGIALDADHNIYFGLGTANYANAYLLNDDGVARFDLGSDRGTVQKVTADFSGRETVCTGVRFPVAMAFNAHGDLFCSEQEGATWLPNGNPLDELLHIQRGRHYGFPPRHPRHNPSVIDEPSTFDYAPQHQSTCGMVFNHSVNGGEVFGPKRWTDDAIVCGESRGKLWRTRLIRTPAGYVASTQLFASLQMLTVDACVSPDGSLIVACHSGPPDWGTGPAGIGKLFRIETVRQPIARPVAAWADGPREIRVAFDHPVDPQTFRNAADLVRVEYGRHVRAADRFENLVPPYAVVRAQSVVPRYNLAVHGVSLTSDMRTVILNTDVLPADVCFAVTLPSPKPNAVPDDAIPQRSEIDVDLDLTGVRATWTSDNETLQHNWTGWLPHADFNVSRHLLVGSAVHAELWPLLQNAGELTLATKLNVRDVLRPAVQRGATIDYSWPEERVTVTITAAQPFRVTAGPTESNGNVLLADVVAKEAPGRFTASFDCPPDSDEPIPVTITLATSVAKPAELSISVHTNEDSRPRPIPLHRFVLPWVKHDPSSASGAENAQPIAELEGGSWARGRRVFRSEAAGCFKCHAIGGNVVTIGPNLANLVHRDYGSVFRDVVKPSFAINPDYISHTVVVSDGRIMTGVLQSDGDELLVGDEKGKVTRLKQKHVESMRPSAVSVMPNEIAAKLPKNDLRDLLTYLLTAPPSMPMNSPLAAPPLRTVAEVNAALAGAPDAEPSTKPLQILMVAGKKDHGPGEHDYPAWQTVWHELISAADNVNLVTAWEFPSAEQLENADIAIFFQKGAWDDVRAEHIDAFLQRGGGLVYIHWAVNGNDNVQAFSKRIGYASWGGKISFRHGPLTLDIHNTDHPIVRNFDQLHLYDESYWKLTGDPGDVTLLATSTEDGMPTPQMWVTEKGKGRVFVSIPGHYSWTFDDPLFRILLLRGIAWTAREPVDRFNELVTIGARMKR
jgi:putative heme-binding domain-containing protein